MNGDMMRALSGSSLLSLSSGTLPAVKAGMNLDANPFASQLALMTGPDAAIDASVATVAPVAADGADEFALALAEVVETPVAAGTADIAVATAGPALPTPRAAGVIAPRIVQLSGTDAIEPLPVDATSTQIIEAVMNGVAPNPMSDARNPSVKAAVPADLPAGRAECAQRAAITTATAPVPREAVIADTQKLRPQPLAAATVSADVPVYPETVLATDGEYAPAETSPNHLRRAAKESNHDVAVVDPVMIAPAVTPVTMPQAAAPEAAAPENGTTRVAISIATAPVSAPLGEEIPEPSANSRAAVDPAVIRTTTAVPQTPIASAAAVNTTEPVQVAQPAEIRATPEQAVTAPAPVSTAPTVAAPAMVAPAPFASAASAPPQSPRAAAPALRAAAGTTAQRAVQSAAQSPQPAQALAALFNLSDAAAEPLPVEGMTELPTVPRIEAVQPSWVAALNAVTSPVTSPAVQALAAPGAASAPQAPLEMLAFDAGFIGNIETQISRVMGGGQMVRMQIMPEHLGRIDIEMLAGPDRDQVRLVTEHDAVRDTLVQSQVRLEQDLRQSGQRNTEVTVELRQQSAGTQGGSAQQQRGQAGSEAAAQRDATQRQNSAATAEPATPAQRRPRGNVRYA